MACDELSNFPNGIYVGKCFVTDANLLSKSGWADYRDSATATTPITLNANTWTSLTCNDVGSITSFLPLGADGEQVTRLWSSTTNRIDISQLQAGQDISVRTSFRLYPSQNNAQVDFRILFETSGSVFLFDLQKRLARLDEGADSPAAGNDIYPLVEALNFFISPSLPLDSFISVQVKPSVASEAEVDGLYIRVS